MTARSANWAGNRYLYGMSPEYQCSFDGSQRGAQATTNACPSTRRTNSDVQTATMRKLKDILSREGVLCSKDPLQEGFHLGDEAGWIVTLDQVAGVGYG